MTTKSASKKTKKQQAADQGNETPVAQKKTKGTKPATTKATTRKPAETPRTEPTPAATTTDATPELVVFAFRLSRSERDEIHAATGSAKASRFVKAIVLAGARGDMKAIGELVDEIHATRE